MRTFKFITPQLNIIKCDTNYGQFEIEPLERGFAQTLGQAIRNELSSTMQGVAIVGVKIPGVYSEFMSLDGIQEDMGHILINLKSVKLKKTNDLEEDNPALYNLSYQGTLQKGTTLKASDLTIDSALTLVNPEQVILVATETRPLDLTCIAQVGRGYSQASELNIAQEDKDMIILNPDFSPVEKVSYDIQSARVEGDVSYEKLQLNIWVNGTCTPLEVLKQANELLEKKFQMLAQMSNNDIANNIYLIEPAENQDEEEKKEDLLDKSVDDLSLSQRAFNSLKGDRIFTLRDLTEKTENEIKHIKNLGKKTLLEIKEALKEKGLSFKSGVVESSDIIDEDLDSIEENI